MFEEDCQWSSGKPDLYEEDLHRRLFGDICRDPSANASRASATGDEAKKNNRKKKRKRERELAEEKDQKPSKRRPSKVSRSDTNDNAEFTPHDESIPPCTLQKFTKSPENGLEQDSSEEKQASISPSVKSRPASKLFSKMSSHLEGSRFRMINQQLYTSSGADAKRMFDEDPGLFQVYHRGFAAQVAKWPENPIDRVIVYVQSLPDDVVVCDFGCGEAKLAENVRQRVHSFDLVAINERVTACDMASVPLKRHKVDVCVFCLSLMGTNVSDFIREARRVVRKGGEMRIYEVSSRFTSFEQFSNDVEAFGFKLVSVLEFSKMFVEFVFMAVKKTDVGTDLPQISLKPCVYKRR